jgi:AbiV family abortive infection protein
MRDKPLTIVVTEELWKDTMRETIKRILNLLDSSEKLLQNKGDVALCAGLYTYAVEEHGKLLFLQDDVTVSGNVTIVYKEEFRNHAVKIPKALANLPIECKLLRTPIFDPAIFDPNIFDTQEVLADFEARMAIFYTDFKDSRTELLFAPPVEADKLAIAIKKLREIVSGLVV